MKLLDEMMESHLQKSDLFGAAVEAITTLTAEVEKLSQAVTVMAEAIKLQQQAIQELYARQGFVMKSMRENSIDLKMPDCHKEKPEKPN